MTDTSSQALLSASILTATISLVALIHEKTSDMFQKSNAVIDASINGATTQEIRSIISNMDTFKCNMELPNIKDDSELVFNDNVIMEPSSPSIWKYPYNGV